MKALIIPLALLATAFSGSQVKMAVTVNGQAMGSAILKQNVPSAGRITQSIHITITPANADLSFESIFDRMGRPIKDTGSSSVAGQSDKAVVLYSAKTIKVTRTTNGKTTVKSFAIPQGNLADASNVWFVTVRPKPGTKSTHLSFDPTTSKWKTETSTYVGDEPVPGTAKKGHHIHHENGDSWVDDKGLPYRMEMDITGAKLIMTRTN